MPEAEPLLANARMPAAAVLGEIDALEVTLGVHLQDAAAAVVVAEFARQDAGHVPASEIWVRKQLGSTLLEAGPARVPLDALLPPG